MGENWRIRGIKEIRKELKQGKVTQRQRAEVVNQIISRVYQNVDDHGCVQFADEVEADVGKILVDYATTSRQEALREAVIVISQFSTDQPLSTNELRIALMQALYRLAREEVKG